jgi:hypothetical protein
MGFTNLHFGGVVVTDSPSQAVAIAQTEHFTVGGNPDDHAQGGKITLVTLSRLFAKKKTFHKNS